MKPKSVFILLVILALCTCIDPYSPKLKGIGSLLVVDGMITNENSAYTVKLSRTIYEPDAEPVLVSNANVFISDDAGNINQLNYTGSGIYKTDSTVFTGSVGSNYVLHVLTREGEEYESDPCLMEPVPDIDSLYYEKDQELANNGSESQDGIMIYLDSKPGNNNRYYRWDFLETWKFQVPFPKRYDYINEYEIIPVAKLKQYCWKSRKSDGVLIHSVNPGQSDHVVREPIFFIASDKSDRLMLQYSMLVKQYSISESEYDFWKNLKKINEGGGDIFASQPFPVISNIHNVNNPKEMVLGYFQVSAIKQRRINISFSDIVRLGLPFFHNTGCERFEEAAVSSFDKLYALYCITSDYDFIEPIYNPDTGQLQSLVFARPECADCELTGTSVKPDFWTESAK